MTDEQKIQNAKDEAINELNEKIKKLKEKLNKTNPKSKERINSIHEEIANVEKAIKEIDEIPPKAIKNGARLRNPLGVETFGAKLRVRGFILIDVYLTLKDAMDYADQSPTKDMIVFNETYYYADSNQSVFYVQLKGYKGKPFLPWTLEWQPNKKIYIAGPRKGEVVEIEDHEIETLRKIYEKKFGRLHLNWRGKPYKFTPGTDREIFRVPHIDGGYDGYFDDEGYHRYKFDLGRDSWKIG